MVFFPFSHFTLFFPAGKKRVIGDKWAVIAVQGALILRYNCIVMSKVHMNMRGKRGAVVALAVFAAVLVGTYVFKDQPTDGEAVIAAFEAAMAADTAGGATPEETLALFVATLRADDADGAAQYFLLDDELSREKWVARLNDLKRRGLLGQIAEDIEENAQPVMPSYEGDAGFQLLNNDGTVGAEIDMELNPFSGVWKLQSF